MSEPPPKRSLTDTLRPWRSRAVVSPRERQPQVQPKRNFTATLREWHKRAGLFAFLFLGWLGLSGILLNEASDLNLNSVRIDWTWLMSIYGLHADPPQAALPAGGHWLAVAGDNTVLDGKPLADPIEAPLGFVAAPEPGQTAKQMLYIARADSLVLLKPDGTRVDELRMPPLPIGAIRRIGVVQEHAGSIAIQGADTAYQSDDEGESWKPVPATAVQWSVKQPLPPEQRKLLVPFSRPSISVQQILVDAHSGRLFGRFGTFFVDAVGLAALLLATSGVWMMWRTSNARRKQASRMATTPAIKPARKPDTNA
ncbi:PepSY domain-containing protein [Nevskia soli]|uniref:PepSY domain-containing protein n=1 Tax=Nevskia soli TaxID=418856 RepID=UPI001FE10BB3|nr:PepSY domain-containing protein [Nevskia soli]